jgi:DNA-binding transcriptional ArsR family regulator
MSPPAVARQTRLLEDAGLIARHDVPGDGRGVMYTLNHWRHGAITAWLAGTEVGLAEPEASRHPGGIGRPARPFGDR